MKKRKTRINQINLVNIEIQIQESLESFCTSLMDLIQSKNNWTKKGGLTTIRTSLEKVMEIYQGKTKHRVFL